MTPQVRRSAKKNNRLRYAGERPWEEPFDGTHLANSRGKTVGGNVPDPGHDELYTRVDEGAERICRA